MVDFGGSPVKTDDYQKIELFFACRKLKNMDILSKSDPRVVVYLNSGKGLQKIGETEVVRDNLNPNFKTSIYVDLVFEMKQDIRFEVLDVDKGEVDHIGHAETTLGAIAGAKNQTTILDLQNKGNKSYGKIIIKADKVQESREVAYMRWAGIKLANVDGLFDKSDPFLRFLRKTAQGSDTLLTFETEWIKDNLNPIWNGFQISTQKLCNGDGDSPIIIECWDYEKSKKFKLIGMTTTTLNEIKNGRREFALESSKKKHPGTLKLNTFSIETVPTFFDYIRGGEQLNFIAAIDFTGSNGIPSSPSSLHALRSDGTLNQYQQALWAVGEIILNYDYDKMIPTFGFGGKPHFPTFKSAQTLHCFPLTGNPNVAEVPGLPGLMDTYQNALRYVELSGPTFFEPVISGAAQVAEASAAANIYTILLIITDGEIHDMKETVNRIVESQYLPLSIIIIGVGQENFTNMKVLDCDEGKLTNSKGQQCQRDLVQFVPIRDYVNNHPALAKEVLSELPRQLVEYKKIVGKMPNIPVDINISQIQG